jgi:hypothetical protein
MTGTSAMSRGTWSLSSKLRIAWAATAARSAAIDARPFADVVAVGGTAIEKILLEARHERRLRIVFFAVRIAGRKAHVEACLGEEPLLDADDDRQVEYRVVRRDADARSILLGLHDVLPPAGVLRGRSPLPRVGSNLTPRRRRLQSAGSVDRDP